MITDAAYSRWLAADGQPRTILIEAGCNHDGVEITRYLSNCGYVTGASESPSTTHYAALLTGKITFSRRVSVTSAEPSVQVTISTIDLDNIDGALDNWLDDAWEKRSLKAFLGSPYWPRADFRPIFAGRSAALKPNGRSLLSLEIYDEMQRLNFPVTEEKLGGTSANKEAILPILFGEVFNAEPLLVDEGNHEYMIHHGAMEMVIEARDNGAPISVTPTLATGKFRLNQAPIGQILCDAQGAKSAGGSYAHTLAGIVQEIVTAYGDPATRLALGEIDAANFSAFDAAHPQTLGLALRDKTNVLDACNQLAASLQASLFFSRAGLLRLWRPPTTPGTSVRAFTPGDMEAGSFQVVEIIPATPAVTIGYGRNGSPQSTGLAGGLPESTLAEFKNEWREVSVSDAAAVALRRYTTKPTRQDTRLVNEAEAQVEAAVRLDFCKVPHKIVEFSTTLAAMELDFGDGVTVVHPRGGCESGKNGWIIGIDENHGAADSPFRIKLEVLL